MQEIGFGLSVSEVRHYAYKLTENKERRNSPFNKKIKDCSLNSLKLLYAIIVQSYCLDENKIIKKIKYL